MLRVTLAGIRGHVVRFLLTALSVALGVALVSGTFVLRDSIDRTLGALVDTVTEGVAVQVRPVPGDAPRGGPGGGSGGSLPITLATAVAAVDGVERAVPGVQGAALVAGADGTVVRNGGAPGLGFAYRADDPAYRLVGGRAPRDAGEVLLESTTFEKSGLALGARTRAVLGRQTRDVTVVGEVEFRAGLFGATAVLLDDAAARAAFAPDGRVGSIEVVARPGVDQDELARRVAAVLPGGVEAVPAHTLAAEAKGDIAQGLSFVTTFLLVFAGVSLFVGMFIIVNTFSMLVAQRTRELALLRAVGASRGQVVRMVLGEAAVIGLVGAVAGLGLGVGTAALLKAVLRAFAGISLSGGLPVTLSTVVISLAVGTLVTLVAAVLPAMRAARVPPVAAMRTELGAPPRGLRRRGVLGVALTVAGAGALTVGVAGPTTRWLAVGAGALLAVAGLLHGAPALAGPVIRVITWPFGVAGRFVPGFRGGVGSTVARLARENALRTPRRTATTAGALLVGLTLITGMSVLADSAKRSVADVVADQVRAEFVLNAGPSAAVPEGVAERVARVAGVAEVAPVGFVPYRFGDAQGEASAVDAAPLRAAMDVPVASGSLDALDRGGVAVSESFARGQGVRVGSRLAGAVGGVRAVSLTVGAVYRDTQLLGDLVVPRSLFERALPAAERGDYRVYVTVVPGADAAAVRRELTELVRPYLVVSVQDGAEFAGSAAAGVDTILALIYGLLALSVLIAVLGIVNTLALSVFERTREIGLLRAVGLHRGQLSAMIVMEAVATAVFGAVLGMALGLGLGVAVRHGLRDSGLEVLAVSWPTLVVLLVASAVAGVLAAVLPAVRAARLDVLRAIATE